jgi:hypothetical protein
MLTRPLGELRGCYTTFPTRKARRTYDQQEIDLVEEQGGNLMGYEFKWSTAKPVSMPKDWQGAYPGAGFSVITPENYQQLILPR